MITIALCAILCGFCTVFLVMPGAQTHKRWTPALMGLIPLVSLILYLLLGSPGL
jgi:hypothetical protein